MTHDTLPDRILALANSEDPEKGALFEKWLVDTLPRMPATEVARAWRWSDIPAAVGRRAFGMQPRRTESFELGAAPSFVESAADGVTGRARFRTQPRGSPTLRAHEVASRQQRVQSPLTYRGAYGIVAALLALNGQDNRPCARRANAVGCRQLTRR